MYRKSPYFFKDRHSKTIYNEIKENLRNQLVSTSYNFNLREERDLIDGIRKQLVNDGYRVEISDAPQRIYYDATNYDEYILMLVYEDYNGEIISRDELIKRGEYNPHIYF